MSVVLNIDDDGIARYTKTRILKLAGYEVLEGETGSQALELALARTPDLILLDVKLPDINGLEVCRRLKADSRTRPIPVLQISATFVGMEDHVMGLEGGADAYLTAPIEPPVLVATTTALLRARRFEKELARSREMLDDFFENAPAGLQWLARDGSILRANQAQLELVGCTQETYVGRQFEAFCIEPDRCRELLEQLAGGETVENLPLQLRHCDGVSRDVLLSANVLWEDGRFVHARCFIRDITELKRLDDARQRADAALAESRERFRRAMVAAPFPIMIHAEDGEVFSVNDAWTATSGYEHQAIPTTADWLSQAFRGEVRDQMKASIDRLYGMEGRVDQGEYVIHTRSGETRTWHFSSAVVGVSSQGKRLAITMAADITERKQADLALKESEQRFRNVAELMPQIVWTMEPDGTVDYCNHRALEYTGKADVTGWRGWEAVYPEDLRASSETWERALRTGDEVNIEHRIRRHDGEYHWFLLRGLPLRDEAGQIVKWYGTATDIHHQKQAQHALERRGRSLQLLADTATRLLMAATPDEALPDLFVSMADQVGAEVYFNFLLAPDGRLRLNAHRGIEESTAQELEHIDVGQGLCGQTAQQRERVMVEDVQNSTEPRVALIQPLGITAYACHPLLAGERLIGTLSFGSRSRARFEPDELDLMRTFCDEVAMALERNRLNAELRQRAEQLARANRAKDDFLAVLSHELRTPLNSIALWAQYMAEEKPEPEVMKQGLEEIGQSVRMQTRLIDDLLDVSRIVSGQMELHRQLVRLPEVVSAAIGTVRSAAKKRGLSLQFKQEPLMGPVLGDPTRLQQVVWNLLVNAIKFTPARGKVEVTLRQIDGYAEVSVRDTGQGISGEVLPHIFERFWQADTSVRRKHAGLGLGLSIVRHLVEMHGGSVRASSAGEDMGSTFTVTLPLAPEGHRLGPAMDVDLPSAETVPIRLDGLRLLVVDDEAPTGKLVKRVLESRGAEVALATSAAQALELLEQFSPDVLLSDLAMPDRSGHDLIREIRSREVGGKRLPAAALTALARTEDRERALEAGFNEFITKPVDPRQLLQVARALADNLAQETS